MWNYPTLIIIPWGIIPWGGGFGGVWLAQTSDWSCMWNMSLVDSGAFSQLTFFFLVIFLEASAFMVWVISGTMRRANGEGSVSSSCIFFALGLPTFPFTSLLALPALMSSLSCASTRWYQQAQKQLKPVKHWWKTEVNPQTKLEKWA